MLSIDGEMCINKNMALTVFAYFVQGREGYEEIAADKEFGALRKWMVENTSKGKQCFVSF